MKTTARKAIEPRQLTSRELHERIMACQQQTAQPARYAADAYSLAGGALWLQYPSAYQQPKR